MFKIAENEKFGNEIFAEMNKVLTEGVTAEPILKTASLVEAEEVGLKGIVASLVKCAEVLEETGHSTLKDVYDTLGYVSQEINK